MDTGVLSEVKRPYHEGDHSLPSSGEVKNEWGYTATSFVSLLGVERGKINLS
jgi:hypothetical protein